MEILIGIFIMIYLFGKMHQKMHKNSPTLRVITVLFVGVGKILSGITSLASLIFVGFKRTTYGSAEYLSERKADFVSRFNGGFTINGKKFISMEDSTQHLLAVAPSGGGKTTSLVFPAIENISRHESGSLVITDPSGEIYQRSNRMLQKRDYSVYRIDLNDYINSDSFNPILMADSPSAIDALAKTLVTTALGTSSNDPFWNLSGTNILSLIIKIMKKSLPPNEQTLGKLREWVTIVGVKSLRKDIDDLAAANLQLLDFQEYLSFFAQPPKLCQSIIAVLKAVMGNIYDNVDVVTRTHTIDLSELRKGKAAIFVCIPENQQEKYAFLLSLFYEMVFDFCYLMPQSPNEKFNPVYMLLDEFCNMEIGGMTSHITTLRKRKVALMLIIQSFSQLQKRYGNDATTIIGNCKTKIIFGNLDIDSCESISRTIGMTNYQVKKNPFNPFERGREMSRRLIQAEELRRLPDNEIIAIFGRENPIRTKKIPYYKNPVIAKYFE